MKRFYFILAALFVALTAFAGSKTENVKESVSTFYDDTKGAVLTLHQDVKDITTTLYGDGKDAVTSLYPDVKSAIVAIGKAIGVAAEHVYTVLVKKFVVDGIVQALPFLLGLILVSIGWFKMSKFFKEKDQVDWHILYPLFLLLFGIISLGVVNYNTMIMGLVNPEYGALNYILEYSKEMIK